jgi:SAM-dependent methyltransferase
MTAGPGQCCAGNPYDQWAELLAVWEEFADAGDVDCYTELSRQFGRPAVELGVGSGRVASKVAPDYGIDSSEVMLRRCRDRTGTAVTLINADIRTYRLPEPAAFSYAPLNTLNAIAAASDRQAALANILANTVSGGHLAFDTVVPNLDRLWARHGAVILRANDGKNVIFDVTQIVRSEPELLARIHAFWDVCAPGTGLVVERRYYPPLPFVYLFPEQIQQLAESTGWLVEASWGGFGGEPLTPQSHSQLWLLRKP